MAAPQSAPARAPDSPGPRVADGPDDSGPSIPVEEDAGSAWPDEAAESSFLAEARERGESVSVAKPKPEAAEEPDTAALPPLNELVNRIPPDVREVLDELFRARFVTVKRLPKRALKS